MARANGEGTIYERKDGRYEAAAYVVTPDGSRRRKRVYGKTREEVAQKLVELLSLSTKGIPIPTRSARVGEYLEYWLTEVVCELEPTTRRGYESAVRLHLKPALGSKRLDKLSAQDVRQLLSSMKRKCLCCTNGYDRTRKDDKRCCSVGKCCERFPSARQIQYVHAVLRNALSSACRDELLMRNVAKLVKVPSPRYRTGRGLSVDRVKDLLRLTAGHRLHALFVLAATMGLRRGELLGLHWADLDLVAGTLDPAWNVQRVDGELLMKRTKTPDSENRVPLPPFVTDALKAHKSRQAAERLAAGRDWEDNDLVFPARLGTTMEPRNLNRLWASMRDKVGLEGVRLHDLRHTMVTLLLDLGTPPHVVQAVARHADVKVTMKIYAHANLEEMRKAVGKLGDTLG